MCYAQFDRFELELSAEQAESVSMPGQDASGAVEEALQDARLTDQLDAIGADAIRDELNGYGAWDDEELADDAANRARIVWIAGGNISEENFLNSA